MGCRVLEQLLADTGGADSTPADHDAGEDDEDDEEEEREFRSS